MAEKTDCGALTAEAGELQVLNRPAENAELWDFVRSWLRRFAKADGDKAAERFVCLWAAVMAWAAKGVPDLRRAQEETYLAHGLARDLRLAERFANLYKIDREFHKKVDRFLALSPVFQAAWLQKAALADWDPAQDRRAYIAKAMEKADADAPNPFAPACGRGHIQAGEKIPADWAHVFSMIAQARRNLFHGGKNYKNAGERQFLEPAMSILWEVWRFELPSGLLLSRVSWLRALLRSGFMAREAENRISLADETEANRKYLQKLLAAGHFGTLKNGVFLPNEPYVEESYWLRAVDSTHGSAEGGQADDLAIMDTHMAGLVRWLNQVGIGTELSCDGHGEKKPFFLAVDEDSARLAAWLLNFRASQFNQSGKTVKYAGSGPNPNAAKPAERLKKMLDVAEWLAKNREDLKVMVAAMRKVSAPKTPPKTEPLAVKDQSLRPK
ncbi:MAG: hypothetical protein MUC72_11460 [Acidobacteria bacterium]|jgi:hypothetical protein|nr:hypothetical protein [Acidobacteriota bacterium]